MRSNQLRSALFVVIQFACLGIILLTGPWLAKNPPWLALELLGAALGLWTLWTMRSSRFNILPDVLDGAQLVTAGPYRFIRHPMYATLLLVTLALVLDLPSPLRMVTWLVLLVDLVLKLSYEEGLLVQRFPAYAVYQQSSKRLIPFVF
jgi:protein-S-isoprenylcysteine O-methyltransferase Ste14